MAIVLEIVYHLEYFEHTVLENGATETSPFSWAPALSESSPHYIMTD
jgi:hypothetical protein